MSLAQDLKVDRLGRGKTFLEFDSLRNGQVFEDASPVVVDDKDSETAFQILGEKHGAVLANTTTGAGHDRHLALEARATASRHVARCTRDHRAGCGTGERHGGHLDGEYGDSGPMRGLGRKGVISHACSPRWLHAHARARARSD